MTVNGVEDYDAFNERLQKANGEEYEKIPEELKQETQAHVEEATAQATPAIRNTVQKAADTLYEKVDETREKEQYYTPSPKTWQEFKRSEMTHIHQALNSLGELVGKSATNAKENLTNRLDEVMDRTTKVVHSLRHATSFLHREQKRIETESLEMNEDIQRIQKNLKELQNMMAYAQDPEIQKKGEDILKETVEMMKNFGEMYALSQDRSKKYRPFRVAEHMEAARDAIHKTRIEMDTYLTTAKTAVATKSESVLKNMIGKIQKAAKKGRSFMTSLKESVSRGIQKGKDAYSTISKMHLALVLEKEEPSKIEDVEITKPESLQRMTDDMVEKMAKSGMTQEQIEAFSKNFVKEVQKKLDAATKKPQTQEMTKENAKSQAR